MLAEQTVFEAVIGRNEEGYLALIPQLPSCSAYGETLTKAIKNISEVATLSLAHARKYGFAVGSHEGEEYLRGQGFDIVEKRPIRIK
ncbi:hypothetical protein IBTHAUMO2_990026 [Nitrosopumilaceae archaeon]|nr:type II toxin-antitoxin system HicB family antitoxin [Nitrosopumilus sp.]CAI9832794.1 hypothetical protein IBTHAUMO2_990026 [Nitrosopumilaceae archaeon]MDA7944385.1 type II toxin-antitoxin system HicB family antitoxin [Nitrosopumilus sp.]MDA7954137.1 type II toxin-antitoxin system HicB family antitoxin [Nitrosopumilus sp.]MDA7960578.1 type II toxin-antitoxin system HicB family antitoxin [Nitrosopumilus sp.]